MAEAVIVDAIRTPIGRAVKGTLRDLRADDLAAIPLRALVERNPGVDFSETDDIMMGCGFPEASRVTTSAATRSCWRVSIIMSRRSR